MDRFTGCGWVYGNAPEAGGQETGNSQGLPGFWACSRVLPECPEPRLSTHTQAGHCHSSLISQLCAMSKALKVILT